MSYVFWLVLIGIGYWAWRKWMKPPSAKWTEADDREYRKAVAEFRSGGSDGAGV